MHTIVIENLPTELYEALTRAAEQNRRTLSGEVVSCLERALGATRPDVEIILAEARALREKTAAYPITDEEFNEAKAVGRP